MKTLGVISLGLQFLVALLTADLYTVAHDCNLHKWNSYLWVQILKQLTGARLSTMPIYCLLCRLKENYSPCFKAEYHTVVELEPKLKWNKSLILQLFIFMFFYYGNGSRDWLKKHLSGLILSTSGLQTPHPFISLALVFQGMHELLAPIVFILHCDHQAFLHASESAQPRQVFIWAPSVLQALL